MGEESKHQKEKVTMVCWGWGGDEKGLVADPASVLVAASRA